MGYTTEEKRQARKVLGIRSDDGNIPLKERSREALIDTINMMSERHKDQLTELQGANDALKKRLKDHRKAKALANTRADRAVAALRAAINEFEGGTHGNIN